MAKSATVQLAPGVWRIPLVGDYVNGFIAGGLEVVHTPGHSPGHAAYLHRSSGVLITGDSIFNVRGLRWPIKSFCTDFRLTQRTAHRLADLEYTTAAFTHGPEIRLTAREEIRGFLAKQTVPRD
ncbi:MBL fold metallo-hydrolase [Pedococcus sp. NPDC057267]|uniref:MBL fold metallo-hydrolase n=1 Tax=Pedococcus sp. NPDC057267 TaxID=3346077 RepID=UPI003644704F